MGRAVGERADLAIVTNDNPRREKPADIAKAVSSGCRKGGRAYVQVELDRRAAIRRALESAKPETSWWWPAKDTSRSDHRRRNAVFGQGRSPRRAFRPRVSEERGADPQLVARWWRDAPHLRPSYVGRKARLPRHDSFKALASARIAALHMIGTTEWLT